MCFDYEAVYIAVTIFFCQSIFYILQQKNIARITEMKCVACLHNGTWIQLQAYIHPFILKIQSLIKIFLYINGFDEHNFAIGTMIWWKIIFLVGWLLLEAAPLVCLARWCHVWTTSLFSLFSESPMIIPVATRECRVPLLP